MHEALAFAVKKQMLPRNVTDAVNAPKFSRKQMITWTAGDARRFLAFTPADTYSPIWLLMLTTGVRRGEALGARWQDFDALKGMLHIRQTIIDVGGHAIISQPKTSAGRRAIRLSPSCIAALKEYRKKQAIRRLAAAEWTDTDLIFTTGEGRPIQPRVLSRAFDVLQRKAAVPRIRLHDLQHSHASLLFNDGKNIKMISQRLGHADVGITLSVYAHLADNAQEQAAGSIDGLIFGTDMTATGTD
jgi:integrase